MLKDQQQLFFNFCHSLGLDQGFSQQIFSSTGPDINSCLKEALTEWRKSSHCPDPMKVIARALASSTGIDTTMDDGYAVITDTREISLQSLSDSKFILTKIVGKTGYLKKCYYYLSF